MNSYDLKTDDAPETAVGADKLAMLGKMLSEITHEMNTPAGAINAAVVNLQHHLKTLLESLWELNQHGITRQDVGCLLDLVVAMVAGLDQHPRRKPGEVRDEQKRIAESLEHQGIADSQNVAKTIARMDLGEQVQTILTLSDSYPREILFTFLTHCHRILMSAHDIKVSIDLLTHLIRALKSYSVPNAEKPEVTDVHTTLDTALTILNTKLKHKIQVICHYDDLPPVTCYANELSQVWMNLLHNAIQAIQGDGRIVIDTFTTDRAVGVRITDNGVGIPPDIQAQLFQGYVTTKSQDEGSGLGLSIVQQIVTKHGGTITVHSVPGETSFEVLLPFNFLSADPA
jgi:two-component system, NtrC family, sensor kinase